MTATSPLSHTREELRTRLAGWSNGLLNVLALAMLAIVLVRFAADLSPA
jgi:hypothetical protein